MEERKTRGTSPWFTTKGTKHAKDVSAVSRASGAPDGFGASLRYLRLLLLIPGEQEETEATELRCALKRGF